MANVLSKTSNIDVVGIIMLKNIIDRSKYDGIFEKTAIFDRYYINK